MRDIPGLLLATTVSVYWCRVAALSVRLRRRTRRLSGVVPEQALERLMWALWVPLVVAWIVLPWHAWLRERGMFALPGFTREEPYATLRWLAALAAVAALLATIRCWRQMGRNWTMAVVPGQSGELITNGMFARVRHPIYALSIVLMLCTLTVVPAWPVALLALVHVMLMVTKARNEERHMIAVHGARYADYQARTGRFLPRIRSASP